MSRTIYIASSFDLYDRVEATCEAVEDAGHSVPDVWWHNDLKQLNGDDEDWYTLSDVQQIAVDHYDNIANADTFILVAPKDEPKKFNGANIELGYAFAHDLDCYALGTLERSAMYVSPNRVPVKQISSLHELVEALDG